jgi:hypothetical protein
MGAGRFSKLLGEVGALAMPDTALDTTRPVESGWKKPTGAGALRLLVPSVAVGVVIDCHSIADGVEATS